MSYLSAAFPKPDFPRSNTDDNTLIPDWSGLACYPNGKVYVKDQTVDTTDPVKRHRLNKLQQYTQNVFAQAKLQIGEGDTFVGTTEVMRLMVIRQGELIRYIRTYPNDGHKLLLRDNLVLMAALCLYTLFHLGLPLSDFGNDTEDYGGYDYCPRCQFLYPCGSVCPCKERR